MNPLRWLVAKWNKLEARMSPAPVAYPGEHKHRWRYILRGPDGTFLRQCSIRSCGVVEMDGDFPEGVGVYIDLMTAAAARSDPKGQAGFYKKIAPEGEGRSCLQCKRLLPELISRELIFHEVTPRPGIQPRRVQVCPYCQETNILEN